MMLLNGVREEAMLQQRMSRVSLGDMALVVVGRLLGRLLRAIGSLVWNSRVTVLWLFLLMVVALAAEQLVVLALLLAVGVAVASHWVPALRSWAPVVADRDRNKVRRADEARLVGGNLWLRDVGLVPPDDETTYPAVLNDERDTNGYVELELGQALLGVPSSAVVEKAKAFRDHFDAETVRASELGGGALSVRWVVRDPLDEPIVLKSLPPLETKKMSVECAVDSFGNTYSVRFDNVAGALVGGAPGSGKTAGVTSFLLPMALSDDVELTIIDGKGGSDWSSYSGAADRYLTIGDEADKQDALEVLRELRDEMVKRVRGQAKLYGDSNFWNASLADRRRYDQKFKLVVIDECQELFSTSMPDKEAKNVVTEISGLVTTLIKRGRSAGICVLLITQKPTSDAVPTAIRDNCQLRVAFRLLTAEAEKAVMGSLADDLDVPRAMDIPMARKGGAVVENEGGRRMSVRFYYVPEKEQKVLLGGVS